MKLKELFKTLATRAGIAESDAKLTAAIDAIPDFDVDDETVANPLRSNLITEAEAVNQPKIKSRFTAEALNGVDALLDAELGEFMTAEEIETLKKDQKPTMKKISGLLAKAKALKQSGGSAADTAETIRKLNEQITSLKTDKENEVTTLKNQHQTERYYDRLASRVIARTDVTDYAKAKDGRRVMDDFRDTLETAGGVLNISTGKIMRKDSPEQELYIDNKPATVDGLLQKTLDDNGYVKKSDPAPQGRVETEGGNPDQGKVDPSVSRNLERAKAPAGDRKS